MSTTGLTLEDLEEQSDGPRSSEDSEPVDQPSSGPTFYDETDTDPAVDIDGTNSTVVEEEQDPAQTQGTQGAASQPTPTEPAPSSAPEPSEPDAAHGETPGSGSAGVVVSPPVDATTVPGKRPLVIITAILVVVLAGGIFMLMKIPGLSLTWVFAIGALLVLVVGRILAPYFVPDTSDRVPPKLGRPAVIYRVLNNRFVGIPYIPELSDEERLQNEVTAEIARHVELRQQVPHAEFGSFGTRGGSGKGTSASNMAGVAAEASPDPTLIVDSRHTVGNIAPRFGLVSRKDGADFNAYLPHATPTVRQCIALWKAEKFKKSVETRNLLGSFKGYPLWVIAADVRDRNNREAIKRPDVVVTDFTGMMDELADDFSLAFFECNNDEGHDFDLALMRRVDIPVFVYRVNHEYNLDELHGNLEAYRSDPELDRKIQRFGILLVLAATPRQTREQFSDEFGFNAEQVFLVRKDPYFVIGDEDGFDADGSSKRLRTLNTDSPAREPIIRPRLTPLHAKLQYLRAVNHGLELVLREKFQKDPLTVTLPQAA